ncbi:hypothetical protein EX30DRAFT_393301 [Ascodesmis nigricans]|uniref:Rhodopsin domain-containing protein n=1 Tax=Ascodesmis nigricans TaxID=341454 RepID=A0A4V6RHH6_9PEZI|nr:hypothetical protein EX30DRAFT_393301 [Ascodesmis nigricans]
MASDTRVYQIPPEVNRNAQLYGVVIPAIVVSNVVVALRLYVRIRLLNNFASDDKWILAAVITKSALMILSLVQTKYGNGWHMADVPPDLFGELLKQAFFVCLLALITPTLIKISILALYNRLSQEPLHRKIIHAVTGFTALSTLGLALAQIFNCLPVESAWDVMVYPTTCSASPITLLLIHCVINAFTDIVVFALPLPVIFRLNNISRHEKHVLAVILPLGGVSVVASIVRMIFYVQMVKQWPAGDITWMSANNTIWGAIEMCLAIFACSLFALRHLCGRETKEKRRTSVAVPKEDTQMHHGVELWSYVSVQEEGTLESRSTDAKLTNGGSRVDETEMDTDGRSEEATAKTKR